MLVLSLHLCDWEESEETQLSSALSVKVGDGVFEVLSTAGDTHLGGDDFDKRIVDFLADDFKKSEGIELRNDRQVLPISTADLMPPRKLSFPECSLTASKYQLVKAKLLM